MPPAWFVIVDENDLAAWPDQAKEQVYRLVFLLIWFFFLTAGGGWMRRMHGKWFNLSEEGFAAVHYKMLAYFKLLWVMFNLTPYLVLRLFL